MRLFIRCFCIALVFAACSSSKQATNNSGDLEAKIRTHIQYLASDELEGRRTGTAGEEKAMNYISGEFRKIGLSPRGTESYTQNFEVNDGKEMGSASSLIINNQELIPGKDFFIYPYSPDRYIESSPSISLQESNVPWFFDLGEILEENKSNPHYDLAAYMRDLIKTVKDRGANAVIFYNSSAIADQQAFDPKDRAETLTIPVVYVTKDAATRFFTDKQATMQIKLRTSINRKNRIGHNVIGFIDNKAPTTVILGAHYDHLGFGEDGNSMIRSGQPSIHNGADDNASGTAALIELARMLKNSNAKNNNYLFIAFSGEELGLYGSKYFTENPTIDIKQANYMINMDMVGRLNDSSNILTVGGIGTSPSWGMQYNSTALQAKSPALKFKYDSSGTGPSDHTSFYRKDIPVLFFFTGLHTDYHKPSDDAEKVNYRGTGMIIEHIFNLVNSLDGNSKLAFTKTREAQTTTSARFSVSMGIMPDYTYSGTGVRADGVSDGKPAQKAGLKAGDIIIQLGDYPVSSLETYMQALSKFKKGDQTKVRFKRANEEMDAMIEF